jgi:hypothetical protein
LLINKNTIKREIIKWRKNLENASHFPHITRILTAEEKITIKFTLKSLILLFLLIILVSNLPKTIATDKNQQTKNEIISEKINIDKSREVIQRLLNRKEYQLAKYYNEQFLNEKRIKNEEMLKFQDLIYLNLNSEKINDLQIQNWLQIVQKYPDYRDGYAKLTKLFLIKNSREEAKKFYEETKTINPNWPELSKFNL